MNAAMWFMQSYESRDPERKADAADRAVMWFSVFRADFTAAVEENLIKFPKRKPRDGRTLTPSEEVNSRKIELVELVAKIDDGLHRWRSSLTKGQDRIYTNSRIVQRGIRKARSFRRASERGIDEVLSSLNSYIGFCKQMNGYTQAWRIYEALPSCWHRYLHFDTARVAVVPNPGYTRRERIVRKYNLIKPKRYGHKRRNPKTGGTAA